MKVHVKLNERMTAIAAFFCGLEIKFVGGCVRDILCGVEPKDYDLITPVLPDDVEKYIRAHGKKVYTVGKRFGTLGVKIDNQTVEITTYRGEDYNGRKCPKCGFLTKKEVCYNVVDDQLCMEPTYETRKPEVTFTPHLDADLRRRDFTINAMALSTDGRLHDTWGGMQDLQDRVIRAVGNPKVRFKEDPLRILRAVRFAARFGANIEDATAKQMHKARWELQRVAHERIVTEINAMFKLEPAKAEDAVLRMWEFQLWQVIMPELQLQIGYDQKNEHHTLDLWQHTAKVMRLALVDHDEGMFPDVPCETVAWAALLHDVAKPFVATPMPRDPAQMNYIDHDRLGADMADRFLQFYRFSTADRFFIVESIRDHLRDGCWLRPYDNGAK